MAERRDDSFLARWSRRKQAARAAEREQEPRPGAAEVPTRAADADAAAPPDAADATPALPDPSTLDASSDFSVFLGKDVPVDTQRAALRRLWRLDPIYNRVDGLDDYCTDFSDQATVAQGLRTAYQVGRGMLERIGEPAEAASRDPDLAAGAPGAPSPEPRARHGDAPAAAGSLASAAPRQPASAPVTSTAKRPRGETPAAHAATGPGAGDRTAQRPHRRKLPKQS